MHLINLYIIIHRPSNLSYFALVLVLKENTITQLVCTGLSYCTLFIVQRFVTVFL